MVTYFESLDIFGWMEILAMVFGFFYVFFEIKKRHYLWYFCLVSSVLNIFVYSHSNYLSMTVVQFYYIAASLYGIHEFRKMKKNAVRRFGEDTVENGPHKVGIAKFNWKTGAVSIVLALVFFFILVPVTRNYSIANGTLQYAAQPWFDSLIAVGSMLATFYLSKSYICQWYIWLALDTFTIGVFLYSGLYWMAGLYVTYVVMSVIGLINWKRTGVYME